MIGLALASMYLIFLVLTGTVFGASYYHATKFLLYWHLAWMLIWFIPTIVFAAALAVISAKAAEEAAKGKVGGKILALAVGGSSSFLAIIILIFRRLCFVSGAYFLHATLINQGDAHAYFWDSSKLVLGAGLLLIAFVVRK
jgi:hypothetical protein